MRTATLLAFLTFAALTSAQPLRDPQDRPISQPIGTLITIKRDNIVHNHGGNCAWAAAETLARHQGIAPLVGVANGKGAAKPADIDAYLTSRGITQADNAALQAMWESLAARDEEVTPVTDERIEPDVPEQYLVLVTCSNEQHQARLLKRFHDEGLKCKALTG